MSDRDRLKRAAAEAALDLVEDGMLVGLGTGSTVAHFLDLLGRALHEGRVSDVTGVPTSVRTASEAHSKGIPLHEPDEGMTLDLTVDGADEVSPELDLVKGMGGALLREKLVASASARLVIIADASKRVERLGTRSPVPVEVIPFGWTLHLPFLRDLGAEPQLRAGTGGGHETTDNGNYVVDCRFPDGLDDPAAIEEALRHRTGIVENGLFLGMAERAILAGPEGVRVLEAPPGGGSSG